MGLFGGQDPRDILIDELRAQLERGHAEKLEYLKLIKELTDKLSAHADIKAHHAATRAAGDRPEPRRIERSIQLPAGFATLSRAGHVNMAQVRARHLDRQVVGVKSPPPVRE